MASSSHLFYIATGTSAYSDDNAPLPVESDLKLVAAVFEELGYKNALPELSLNPTRDGIINGIRRWLDSGDKKEEVIFYYSGHGESDGDRHYLPLEEGECASEDVFRVFAKKPLHRTLLIFDTCYSGQLTVDIGRILSAYEPGLESSRSFITIITSSRTLQKAAASSFTPALVEVLKNTDGQWGGRNQASIPIQEVIAAVEKQLPEWQRPKVDSFPATTTGLPKFFFPNLRYVAELPEGLDLESQRNAIERRTHWDLRARYFTGRSSLLAQIDAWLHNDFGGRPVVVTGGPGTGKSALLARLVTQKKADISFHARGKTMSQVTKDDVTSD